MNDEKDKLTGREDEGAKKEKKKKKRENIKSIKRIEKKIPMKKKVKMTTKNQHYQTINS